MSVPADPSTNDPPIIYVVEVTVTLRDGRRRPLEVTGWSQCTPETFPTEIAELLGPAMIARLGDELETEPR